MNPPLAVLKINAASFSSAKEAGAVSISSSETAGGAASPAGAEREDEGARGTMPRKPHSSEIANNVINTPASAGDSVQDKSPPSPPVPSASKASLPGNTAPPQCDCTKNKTCVHGSTAAPPPLPSPSFPEIALPAAAFSVALLILAFSVFLLLLAFGKIALPASLRRSATSPASGSNDSDNADGNTDADGFDERGAATAPRLAPVEDPGADDALASLISGIVDTIDLVSGMIARAPAGPQRDALEIIHAELHVKIRKHGAQVIDEDEWNPDLQKPISVQTRHAAFGAAATPAAVFVESKGSSGFSLKGKVRRKQEVVIIKTI